MISYAQNFEDVILERIFKDNESGFYVDIGACHPVDDSVTYHFYLKGWAGINVEPQPKLFSELAAGRERDTNLRLCVGAQAGSETLYITHDVGTSTLSRSIAENYRQNLSVDEEISELAWTQHLLADKESVVQELVDTCAELHQALDNFQAQLQGSADRQREGDLALSEATSYCESLAAQLQRKDDALADAARAYLVLRAEFDEKIRELGALHDRLSKQI